MNDIEFGKLEKVELRKGWSSESSDFTPWLAENENLNILGKAIGMDDLELIAQEKNVGPFRADIVCRDIADNSLVLIENQLEKTDHTHLGQLLTYAAGLNAVTIIWISAQYTEEHRAALDWLNEITDEKFNFFGLEVELWKIGNSHPAPKFNIISKPNNWTRTIRKTSKGEITETKQLQLEYWTEFKRYVEEKSKFIKPHKANPCHWITATIGRSHFHLVVIVNIKEKIIASYLSITGPHAKAHFNLLRENSENIEKEFGEPLIWRELPDNKESQVKISFPDNDPSDKSQWSMQHRLLCETLEKFHRVFSKRIKDLDADEWQPEME
jgi:hypothetical protein